jgi:hypothetical protein
MYIQITCKSGSVVNSHGLLNALAIIENTVEVEKIEIWDKTKSIWAPTDYNELLELAESLGLIEDQFDHGFDPEIEKLLKKYKGAHFKSIKWENYFDFSWKHTDEGLKFWQTVFNYTHLIKNL